MTHTIFKNKSANFSKLLNYGFILKDNVYSYTQEIVDGQFNLEVIIDSSGKIKTKITDSDTGDEYVLHLTENAIGAFVGKVRTESANILQAIADTCFESSLFQNQITAQVIEYVQKKYDCYPEFLWEKTPNNAIFRRKDNAKWYIVLLQISQRKIGLDRDEIVDIIDVRCKPEEINSLLDGKKYFPGYHMNKQHWLTICLDGSVDIQEVCARIDNSYILAKK